MSKIKITGPWDMQKIESYLDTCVVPLKTCHHIGSWLACDSYRYGFFMNMA